MTGEPCAHIDQIAELSLDGAPGHWTCQRCGARSVMKRSPWPARWRAVLDVLFVVCYLTGLLLVCLLFGLLFVWTGGGA